LKLITALSCFTGTGGPSRR